MSDEQSQELEPQWCLVANVRHFIGKGEGREKIERGTKHFSGGTKVYCFPVLWGDGYEQIRVIGKHRGTSKLVVMILHWRYLTNWRAKLIYDPKVLRLLRLGEYQAWSRFQDIEPKDLAERYAASMREREIVMDEMDDLSGLEPRLGGKLPHMLMMPAMGGDGALNHLRWLLRDEMSSIRAKAAGALGKLGKPDAIPILVNHLENEAVLYVREACVRALQAIGTPEALAAVEAWQSNEAR